MGKQAKLRAKRRPLGAGQAPEWGGSRRVVTSGRVRVWTSLGVVRSRTGNTLTIDNSEDVKRIAVGMRLRAGIDAMYARDGEFIVHETNEDTGTVTVHDARAVTSFTNGDQLFFVAELELGQANG